MPGFEPSGDARIAAATLWNYFSALLAAGFTPEQATHFVGQILHALTLVQGASGGPPSN